MRLTRAALVVAVAACAAAAMPTTPAEAATASGTAVSGPSPVPQTGSLCSPLAGPVGRHNYEYQPSLAVSPGGGHRMAAAWGQDFDDAVVVGVSDDGGATWKQSVPGWDGRDPSSSAGFMACENGPTGLNSAHNPHVAVGKDGIVYAMADLRAVAGPGAALVLSASRNGGATWTAPTTLASSAPPSAEELAVCAQASTAPTDCATVTTTVGWTAIVADPRRSGVAYAAWDVLEADAVNGPQAGTEHVVSTTDGGASWSKPATIGTPDQDRMWSGGTLLVRPDGSLVDVFSDCPTSGCGLDTSIRVVTSTNGGQDWSPPVDVTSRGAINKVPDAALSPDGSELYVAWFDDWKNGTPYLSRSLNGGTFTTHTIRTPTTVQNLNVSVAPDGTVGLLYYDRRNNPDADHAVTDIWLARSHDHGLTFTESHVGGPFDVAALSLGADYGTAVGEYQGLRGVPGGFALAYTVGHPTGYADPAVTGIQPSGLANPNPTDIVFSRVAS
jgi:hypothetical protein